MSNESLSASDFEAELTDHNYDGIQEYDNPLPGWWTLLFYATILFAIGYGFFAFARPDWTNVKVQYENEVKAYNAAQAALLGDLEPDAATLLSFLNDPEQTKFLTVGEGVFQTNCASCHKSDGAGISGPNMTDDHYLHVKRIADIPNVVMKGANGGAMPAWGSRLSKNDVVLVSAYVASLRGRNLAGRKAEGEVLAATWEELEGAAAAAEQP